MMLDLGKDAVFIWAAYGISALMIGILVFRTWTKPRP